MSTRNVPERQWVQPLVLAPDPVAIARACEAAGLARVSLLHGSQAPERRASGCDDHERFSFVAAAPDRRSRALDPTGDDDEPSWLAHEPEDELEASARTAPRWIGVIPYESRRGLERSSWCAPDERPAPILCQPQWWRYPAVVRVDHRSGQVAVIGSSRAAMERLRQAAEVEAPRETASVDLHVDDGEPPQAHLARIRRARELIYAGDLYQVNVARRIQLQLRRGSALDLHERMVAVAPARFSALLTLGDDVQVVSTTPELLLHATTGGAEARPAAAAGRSRRWPRFAQLATEPIKGTRPRSSDPTADDRLAAELDEDPKERAELTMIIDVERNDLGSVAQLGSVNVSRAPHVSRHPTVFHRQARIEALVRDDAGRTEVLQAIVPSGSVTGAPKVRAMEVSRELEAQRRGLYTGGLGYVAHDGSVVLAMAIRTLVLRAGAGVYWTGGGIVADSNPERELLETGWKAVQLLRAAGSDG